MTAQKSLDNLPKNLLTDPPPSNVRSLPVSDNDKSDHPFKISSNRVDLLDFPYTFLGSSRCITSIVPAVAVLT